MSMEFRYGFRYDPMKFVESDQSLQGAMVRTIVIQIDPETGEIEREIPLDKVEWVNGVTQVDGKIWVADGFNCQVCIVDPDYPEDTGSLVLGGPGPSGLTSDGNAVWHFDFWAPAIIKSDLNGQLLEWGE